MKKVEWIAVSNAKEFLNIIDLNSVGLEKAKALYNNGDYDKAVEAYYDFSIEKFKKIKNHLDDEEATEKDMLDADMLLQNKVSLLRSDYFDVGDPIDWDFYPYDDKQWQNHLCYMYFPLSLLKAYKKTGDKKYAEKWNDIHLQFIKNHPLGTTTLTYSKRVPMYKNEYLPVCGGEGFTPGYIGGSWISLASSRLGKWMAGLVFMAHRNILDISTLCNMVASIMLEHLPVIINNPRKGTPNQFSHAASQLISISVNFWEAKMAPAAYIAGINYLEESICKTSLLPDGTDLEQSFGYNAGVLESFYENIYSNDELRGNRRIENIYNQLAKRAEFLALLVSPLKQIPPIAKSQNDNSPATITTLKNLIKRYPQSKIVNDVYSAVVEDKVPNGIPLSVDFPYGGYSIMRDGWKKDSMYMLMKYSRYSRGHKHEDANSIVLTALGRNLLIDTGNYNYSDDTKSKVMNDYMFSSVSHNTMDVDGLSQIRCMMGKDEKVDERYIDTTNDIEYEKYMGIGTLHETECEGRRVHQKQFEMIEGIYDDGYSVYASNEAVLGGKHTRRVIFIKNVGFVVDDVLSMDDNNTHSFSQHWNLSLDFSDEDVTLLDNGFVTTKKDGANLRLVNFCNNSLCYKKYYGNDTPKRGYIATGYGKATEGVDIDVIIENKKEVRIITLLYPFIDEDIKIESDGINFSAKTGKGDICFRATADGGVIEFNGEKFEY